MTKQEILDCAILSKAAYDNKKDIKWSDYSIFFKEWINDKKTDTQGFVGARDSDIFVVWRGTESARDFLTDALAVKAPAFTKDVKIHLGFLNSTQSVKVKLQALLTIAIEKVIGGENKVGNIYVTGHSLGGALATISAVQIAFMFPSLKDRIKVVTIGSPRVGNRSFKRLFKNNIKESIRVVHDNDVVPRIPKLNYFHVPVELKLSDEGKTIKTSLNPFKVFLQAFKSNITAESIKDHNAVKYIKAIELWDGIY